MTTETVAPVPRSSPWAGLDSQQMEEEIGVLRDKLRTAQAALERTKAEMHTQRMRTRQLVMAWKHRLQQKEDKLRRERIQRDRELQEISQQLLFFEGQLKQEQQQIKSMLVEKDHVIRTQDERIKELSGANTKLTLAIHSFKARLKSEDPPSSRLACSAGSVDFYLGDNMDSDVFIDDADDYLDHSLSDQSMSSIIHRDSSTPQSQVNSAKSPMVTSSPIYRCKSLPECRIEKGGLSPYNGPEDPVSVSPELSRTRSQEELDERAANKSHVSNYNTPTDQQRQFGESAAVKHRTPPQTNLARNGRHGYGSTPDVYSTSLTPRKSVHFQDGRTESPQQMPSESGRPKKANHMRPRDVKKRSMERTRTTSLKDEAQPLVNQNNTITKKYFSFAF